MRLLKSIRLGALLAALAILGPLWSGVAHSQVTPATGFSPTGQAVLSVTSASGRVALASAGPTVWVYNAGTATAYVVLGDVTATATTASPSFPIPSGMAVSLIRGSNTYVAAITASSTASLTIMTGSGVPFSSVPGGSGGGGSGTVTSVSVVSANGMAGSVATATTTPAITLSTSVTGSLCGNGTAISACSTTGTGLTVLQTSPTLVTPVLGVATGTSLALGGATIGPNALAVTGMVTNTGGTITTNQPFSITQTWNNAATTFTGFDLAITNTTSNSNSKLFRVSVSGVDTLTSLLNGSLNVYGTITQTTGNIVAAGNLTLPASGFVTWGGDLALGRDAANTLAQRNGTNAQLFNIYNTYTDASNYSRLALGYSTGGGANYVYGENAGTGTAKDLLIGVAGTGKNILFYNQNRLAWTISPSGQLFNNTFTIGDQQQVFAVTATQPASPTGTQNAVAWTITSAGSASQANAAFSLNYAGGYTGSFSTYAANMANVATSSTSALISAAGSSFSIGNHGIRSSSGGTTAGLNLGVGGYANNGNLNVGLLGLAQDAKNSATNIGVVGSAINTGTSPVMVGGFFSLNQTTVPTVSAALIADNGAQTSPIFLARDNGTTVFTIADGGGVTISGPITMSGAGASYIAPSVAGLVANNIFLRDNLGTGGANLVWGPSPATTSFPMLKRSGTSVQAKLADDSAFTNIQGKLQTDTNYTAGAITDTGYLTIYDAAGTAYKVPACLASGC